MFVVLLHFSNNRDRAGDFMDDHNEWIGRGFDDGVFLLAGSLLTGSGGTIVAHDCTLSELQERLDEDPFVEHDVVHAEILEIAPSRVDQRLGFLLD